MGKVEELVWKESFNVGIDYIDEAHQKLFAVIRRVLRLVQAKDYMQNKQTCIEVIKFLEEYALSHFAAEEEYQRSIGYEGYEMHKALHDNLTHVTLPHLEEELKQMNFSQSAVEHLLSFLAGWLTGHILIEDRAITDRAESRWAKEHHLDKIEVIDHEFKQFMSEFFGQTPKLINRHYSGEKTDKALYYNMEYKDENGELYDVIMFAEAPVVKFMISRMLGSDCKAIDRNNIGAYLELSRSCAHQALKFFDSERQYVFFDHRAMKETELRERFKGGFPHISLLWRIEKGRLGFCIEHLTDKDSI